MLYDLLSHTIRFDLLFVGLASLFPQLIALLLIVGCDQIEDEVTDVKEEQHAKCRERHYLEYLLLLVLSVSGVRELGKHDGAQMQKKLTANLNDSLGLSHIGLVVGDENRGGKHREHVVRDHL